MKTIRELNPTYEDLNQLKHTYQPTLTQQLDTYKEPFTQKILNEIVLWKVNRYAQFSQEAIDIINKIDSQQTILDPAFTGDVLMKLLSVKGVRLPMASTILRFKNPNIYQIIDQRVYRVIYGKELKLEKNLNALIVQYLDYLQDLRRVSEQFQIPFEKADRVLYALDKQHNKGKIKY